MKSEKYISTSNLARVLGVSRQAIQKRLKNKPGVKIKEIGNSFVYEIDSLPSEIKEEIKKSQKKTINEVLNSSQDESLTPAKLWEAADKLRGSIDPSEYKYIVLGLVFLKYVSDAFYQRRKQIEKLVTNPQGEFFVQDEDAKSYYINQKDSYKSEGVFYIPENARWKFLKEKSSKGNIGKYIDEAMEVIEKENPELKGILPKIYSAAPIENRILNELINLFSQIKFDHNLERERDLLGQVYEYFIGQFATEEGKRGGEFFTPRSLVKLLVEILEPFEGARVFDPACGSGGMFVQSGKFLKEKKNDPNKITFYGQELNINTWKLCKMNLAIRGMSSQIEGGNNSYYDDKFPDLRADFVLSNPPFNANWDPQRLSDNDPRIKYGIPPASNANFMWIQHFIYHLAPNGMAGFVMANGALAVGNKEGEIRKKIIEDDLVDVIIACPPKLFHNVSLPVSLWFLTKNKKNGRFRDRTGETLFIDARDIYEPISPITGKPSRKQWRLSNEQIQKIANTVRVWRGEKEYGEYKDEPGFCKSVKIDEIRKASYVLTPGRYVGIKPEKDDGIPFDVKMRKLTVELEKCFEENKGLEEKIKENLRRFNFN